MIPLSHLLLVNCTVDLKPEINKTGAHEKTINKVEFFPWYLQTWYDVKNVDNLGSRHRGPRAEN